MAKYNTKVITKKIINSLIIRLRKDYGIVFPLLFIAIHPFLFHSILPPPSLRGLYQSTVQPMDKLPSFRFITMH